MNSDAVLLVEDDKSWATEFRLELSRVFETVDCAATWGMAEKRLRKGGYACLILDQIFPGGSGESLFRRVREGSYEPATPASVPVLMISASSSVLASRLTSLSSELLGTIDFSTKLECAGRLGSICLSLIEMSRMELAR